MLTGFLNAVIFFGAHAKGLRRYRYYWQIATPLLIIVNSTDGRFRARLIMCTLIRWIGTLLVALFLCWPTFPQETNHYSRFGDAKWYARQLQSLREEVAKVDADARAPAEARKSGKGVTDAVALDQEPEGVTFEGQLEVLKKRRVLLLRKIDLLEEQARLNAIVPGELRTEYGPEELTTPGKQKLGREA